MKSLVIKGVLVFLLIILAQPHITGQQGRGQQGRGQQGKYGDTPEDSIRCLRNLSLFTDRHRQGNFNDALPFWRVIFEEFPMASRNIYINGVDLLSHMIEHAETEEKKKAYLDTAMVMFDQRIEYFGDAANVLGRKGLFYFQHNNIIEDSATGYEALGKAIELSKSSPSQAVIVTYMNVTVGKFRSGMIDSEQVIETYTNLMEILDNALASSSNNALINASSQVEQLFADSGAANCDALVQLFTENINSAPEDVDLIKKVNQLLINANCTETDLYLDITEKLHLLDPSAGSAIALSAMHRKRDNDAQVINYLKEAIELQDDTAERSNYYLELALIAHQVKNDKLLSRQYASQALQDNPALGRAHLHIGTLYASENNCFDGEQDADFKKRTIYWAAVDRFNEAKRVDPSLAEEANRLIETYSIYFPDNETIFFHGLTIGDPFQVGCWVNETSRIRARKE